MYRTISVALLIFNRPRNPMQFQMQTPVLRRTFICTEFSPGSMDIRRPTDLHFWMSTRLVMSLMYTFAKCKMNADKKFVLQMEVHAFETFWFPPLFRFYDGSRSQCFVHVAFSLSCFLRCGCPFNKYLSRVFYFTYELNLLNCLCLFNDSSSYCDETTVTAMLLCKILECNVVENHVYLHPPFLWHADSSC